MPLLNGLEACRRIRGKIPSVKIVFLTMNEDPELAVEAMKSGGSGYVLKKSAASELLQAMQAALRGKSYITPQIAIQLLAEGKSMKEAADVLNVAPRTVAFHKYRVMQDFGFKTNADLIQFAVKSRIVVE